MIREFIRRLRCDHDYRWTAWNPDAYALEVCEGCGHKRKVPPYYPEYVQELDVWSGLEWGESP